VKPPWLGTSQETAELEALQTDVMRFVAILGLCLAAIFSLVHSAAVEQSTAARSRAETEPPPLEHNPKVPEVAARPLQPMVQPREVRRAEPLPQTPSTPQQEPEPAPTAAPEPVPTPAPDPVPDAPPAAQTSSPEHGFTLEFASARALQSLLREGRVQLYASQAQSFWRLDVNGRFSQAAAPGSYYDMHPGTVPADLRSALPLSGQDGTVAWGVTLPAAIVERVRALTASEQGGNLVIFGDGSVQLEPGQIR